MVKRNKLYLAISGALLTCVVLLSSCEEDVGASANHNSVLQSSAQFIPLVKCSDETSAFNDYLEPLNSKITHFNELERTGQLVGHAGLYTKLVQEMDELTQDHCRIIKETPNTKDHINLTEPMQQYLEVANLNVRTTALRNVVSYMIAHPLEKAMFYPIEATGYAISDGMLLNDTSLAIPGFDATKANEPLKVTMLQGSREPLSFIIKNLSEHTMHISSITVDDLVGGRSGFSADRVDFKVVKNWYVANTQTVNVESSGYGLKHPILAPELLLKNEGLVALDLPNKGNVLMGEDGILSLNSPSATTGVYPPTSEEYLRQRADKGFRADDSKELQPITIIGFNSRQIWVTLNTNGFTDSGNFNGTITVKYTQGDSTEHEMKIPLKVTVIDQPLSPIGHTGLTYGVYYAGLIRNNNDSPTLTSIEKTPEQYRADMEDIKAHGILYPTLYTAQDYAGSDTVEQIAEQLKIRTDVGLPCDKVYLVNGMGRATSNDFSDLKNRIEDLRTTIHANPQCSNATIYLYGKDEAYGTDLQNEQAAWSYIQSLGYSDVKIWASSFHADVGDAAIVNNLDTLNLRQGELVSEAQVERIADTYKAKGKDIFAYGNPQSGLPNPFPYRNFYGFKLQRNEDYTGAMAFAYQVDFPAAYGHADDPSGKEKNSTCHLLGPSSQTYCSAWNTFASTEYYSHMFTFPGSHAPIDTTQWEGYADAVNDIRYQQTLQDMCDAQKGLCNFNPDSLIVPDDPVKSRANIIKKIMLLKGVR